MSNEEAHPTLENREGLAHRWENREGLTHRWEISVTPVLCLEPSRMGVFDKQICTEKSKWRVPANRYRVKGKLEEEAELLFQLGT